MRSVASSAAQKLPEAEFSELTIEREKLDVSTPDHAGDVPVDEAALAELGDSIAEVLKTECDSRQLHRFVDGEGDLADRLWGFARDLGWLALGLPEDYGGIAMGIGGLATLQRELGRVLAPGPFIATMTAGQLLLIHGEERHKEDFLSRLIAGELKAAIPALGSQSSIEFEAKGGHLDGKMSYLLGSVDAGLALVPYSNEDQDRAWGLVSIDGKTAKLVGQSGWDPTRAICTLRCERAPVAPVDSPGVAEDLDLQLAVAVSADCVGGAEAIIEQTVEYLKGRTQFDRVVASFQALKHRVANLTAELSVSRLLALQAVDSAAAGSTEAALWCLLAKASATDAYAHITQDCLQLHGGIGFTWEYDCHLFLKRARLNRAIGGNNTDCLDRAAESLQRAVSGGRSVMELPL